VAVLIFFLFLFCSLNAQQVTIEHNGNIVSKYPASSYTTSSGPALDVLPCDNLSPFNWILKFTAPGRVFKDISFANPQVGFIVTELGAVYKSTNTGDNWTSVMNLGFPYYWYGVHALTPDTIVIAGFNNQDSIRKGVVRWSFNGGTTWSSDIRLRIPVNGVGWLERVHFFNQNTGIVFNSFSGGCWYTTTGGRDSSAWTYIVINNDQAWFAGNIDAQSNGNVYATGIHFAHSTNFGVNWVSGPSADNVFDGGVDFLDFNNLYGWTGGGTISPSSTGWVHRTTDGGQTWSPRLNTFPFPIRAVGFFSTTTGLAVGGYLQQESGGIYSTTDGGNNWNLDVNTVAEMFSVESTIISNDSMDIWCVGSTGGSTGFTGKLYKTRTGILTAISINNSAIPNTFGLYQNYPNPFNPSTKIRFSIPPLQGDRGMIRLTIFDIVGRQIELLVNQQLKTGTYEIEWNASNHPSGIYFYTLKAGTFSETEKMIFIK
jgi:type IX secretion system substrate protein